TRSQESSPLRRLSAGGAEQAGCDEQCDRRVHPAGAVTPVPEVDEPEPEGEHEHHPRNDEKRADPRETEQQFDVAGGLAPTSGLERHTCDGGAGDEEERAEQVEEE